MAVCVCERHRDQLPHLATCKNQFSNASPEPHQQIDTPRMPTYYLAPSFCGAIAQLGERYNGIVEVGSSILPGSTNIERLGQSPDAFSCMKSPRHAVFRPPLMRVANCQNSRNQPHFHSDQSQFFVWTVVRCSFYILKNNDLRAKVRRQPTASHKSNSLFPPVRWHNGNL